MRTTRRTYTIAGLVLITACNSFDVQNLNAPTAETLTSSPTRDVLARTAIGIQAQASTNTGAIIERWGIFGREGWNLSGSDPRETGEELHGPLDPAGRGGSIWTGEYEAIRTINTYQTALQHATGLTAAEVQAGLGFAKTLAAEHFHTLALRSGPTGIPIAVDRPISDPPAPLVAFAEAMADVSAMLDTAYTDLLAGGDEFPFAFVPGFEGFTTPTTFATFNRALAAKVLVHRATFDNCSTCWAQAATAINESFITTSNMPASLSLGVYYGYTGAANETANPISEPLAANTYWVHPSIISGAQLRPDGTPDLRLTRKVAKAGPRTLNDLTGTYKPVMYNQPGTLAANPGANIPWITNEELLLLRAEIRWHTGDKAGALADIDIVRVNSGGLAPTTLTPSSSDDAFITELLYNRLYSLMWTQGTRWIDARRYGRLSTLPTDRPGDVLFSNMLIPVAECDARGLTAPCSIGG